MIEGDFVKVKLFNESIEGIVMPSSKTFLVLKIESGYNLGIERSKIKKVNVIKKMKLKKTKTGKQPTKAKISILHTGGTIASKIDYTTGAVSAKFSPEELLKIFPELKKIGSIRSKLITNILSENMRFEHYNLLAKEVKKELDHSEGIIITQGTDTLHYTSAALSFILQGLSKPVVLVGAQRSSDRGSSDAFLNLEFAAKFITQGKLPGVYVCMHDSMSDDKALILRGVNCRKFHSSRRDAFKPVNLRPVAEVSTKIKWVDKPKIKKTKFELKLFKKVKIGLLKVHPDMNVQELRVFKDFDGLVIEGTGLGHMPIEKADKYSSENENLFKELKKLTKKIPVVMTTQTVYGRVNMQVYTPGRKLIDIGVLGNYGTMTSETAFIKLAWVISNFKQVDKIMMKNFFGENSERLEDEL